jgi:L-asparagine oxygenase
MSSIIIFDNNEFEIIIKLANQLSISPSNNPDEFCKKAKELSKMVPNRIKLILYDFIKIGSPTGYILFTGIYTNNEEILECIPPTPSSNKYKIGEGTLLARIQAILIHIIGEMIAYEAEGYGELFQDIVPDISMANKQTSIGSNTELEIHTEQAFSKLRPDFLSLACLRGDDNAYTYILPIQTILEKLSFQEIDLLKQPLWYTGVDLSFKLNNHEFQEGDIRGPMPILQTSENGDLKLVFDQDLMRGIDDISNQLIKKIIDIYYEYRIQHSLKSGEIIFIDNRMAVHGRSPFFPKYDGNDRFLIRCFATLNYHDSEYARINGGRTVATIYS